MPEQAKQNRKRRQLSFASLSEVITDAQALYDSGYDRLGAWSLGQCCNHLAVAMDMSIDGFPATLPPPVSTFGRWAFFKFAFIPRLVGNLRFPTFPSAAQPQPVDDQTGLDRLQKAVARISDPDASFGTNPFMGRLSQPQWLQFHAIHAQRHLGFLIPSPAGNSEAS